MSTDTIPRRRVVITGLGAITPVGNTAHATWAALTAGRSGIGRITRFDPTGCPAEIGGEVKGFEPAAPLRVPLHPRGPDGEPVIWAVAPKEVKKLGRFTHLGLAAVVDAYTDSGLDAHRLAIAPERIGVNLGVGMGGLPEIIAMHDVLLAGGYRKISAFLILQISANILAGQAGILLNCRGSNMSVASACATSGHALGESFRAIQRGEADIMVAGGSEAVMTPLAVGAFAQMRALSTRNDAPEKASRPYDRDRDGFVMGEGAGIVVLEDLAHAKKRGATIYAEVIGYGLSGDAYHITAPTPDGDGAYRSMEAALKRAKISPSEIDYINAHGTSTPLGDEIEL
ncbi:MAG: beta-ketoacyl-ACP synthase II, partial [Pseudomonadota bacterium]